ncbi:MAG: LysR family transcriptional regulator [Elusimicrobiota bacterium]|nr:MAG: LysR family transcriptional regulator [Elusimicrobiota bacterium]
MDLYQLRYFLETARELNFTRAAANLGVSTPAVSKSVALLERSVGQPLLTRTRRLVQLTQAGERLKVHAERVFDEVEAARLDLRGEAGSPAMLKIGSREMITNYLLGPSLLELRKLHPSTRTGIYELGPKEMAAALKKNQIDFAFYYSAEIPDPSLEIRRLGHLDSHVYAAPSLWKGAKAPKTFDEVRKLPFIAPRYFGADPAEASLDGFPDQESPGRSSTRASSSRPTAASPSTASPPRSCPTSRSSASGRPACSRASRGRSSAARSTS